MDDAGSVAPVPVDSSCSSEGHVTVVQPLESIAAKSLYSPLTFSVPRPTVLYRGQGLSGDPVPYTLRNDSSLTILLLLCFVFFVVSLARSKHLLARQLKDFLFVSHSERDDSRGGEYRFLVFLSLLDALVLAITTYLLTEDAIIPEPLVQSNMILVAVAFAAFLVYFCMKWLAGMIVNLVFFGVKKNLQWVTLQLQVTALEGVLLFPVLSMQIYFGFSVENAIIYIGTVLFLNKIITFYRSYQIFFKGNGLYLQTFLYFCALEIVPLLAFGFAGLVTIDLEKINF